MEFFTPYDDTLRLFIKKVCSHIHNLCVHYIVQCWHFCLRNIGEILIKKISVPLINVITRSLASDVVALCVAEISIV